MRKLIGLIIMILLIGCSEGESTSAGNMSEGEYGEKLKEVSTEILQTSTIAEEMLNVYSELWSLNIETDIDVDMLAKVLDITNTEVGINFENEVVGYRVISNKGNFDNIINQLEDYYSEEGDIDELQASSNDIKEKIKSLNDPPEEFQKAYDETVELYTIYKEYISLAKSPDGSLLTFNEKRRELSSDIVSKIDKIDVLIPNTEIE
ncbi:hypothetical protein [Halobacillus seohaensis]|uniref:Lipoprotein n=1 Tax=Halobacillus seohaensis TaxID=447421 RepID=A0ABW2EKW0_9BACI